MELLAKTGQALLLLAIIGALFYCVIATALDIFYQRCDPGGIDASERREALGEFIPPGAPREDEDDE